MGMNLMKDLWNEYLEMWAHLLPDRARRKLFSVPRKYLVMIAIFDVVFVLALLIFLF